MSLQGGCCFTPIGLIDTIYYQKTEFWELVLSQSKHSDDLYRHLKRNSSYIIGSILWKLCCSVLYTTPWWKPFFFHNDD